ncbi:hypothetical protein BSKO_11948 [Bryopsis sp. KO-2023]|nr:hypothetical protein BSKO_11948 [Bryopsis sp. KO-2023]
MKLTLALLFVLAIFAIASPVFGSSAGGETGLDRFHGGDGETKLLAFGSRKMLGEDIDDDGDDDHDDHDHDDHDDDGNDDDDHNNHDDPDDDDNDYGRDDK